MQDNVIIDDESADLGRTFESRLLFLNSIYSNKYDNITIMAKCVSHKLKRSYIIYLSELEKDMSILNENANVKLLRRLK